MKIEITEKGVTDPKGQRVEVGTQMEIECDSIPSVLLNKCRIMTAPVETDSDAEKDVVVNPAKDGGKKEKAK